MGEDPPTGGLSGAVSSGDARGAVAADSRGAEGFVLALPPKRRLMNAATGQVSNRDDQCKEWRGLRRERVQFLVGRADIYYVVNHSGRRDDFALCLELPTQFPIIQFQTVNETVYG